MVQLGRLDKRFDPLDWRLSSRVVVPTCGRGCSSWRSGNYSMRFKIWEAHHDRSIFWRVSDPKRAMEEDLSWADRRVAVAANHSGATWSPPRVQARGPFPTDGSTQRTSRKPSGTAYRPRRLLRRKESLPRWTQNGVSRPPQTRGGSNCPWSACDAILFRASRLYGSTTSPRDPSSFPRLRPRLSWPMACCSRSSSQRWLPFP